MDKGLDDYSSASRVYVTKAHVTPRAILLSISLSLNVFLSLHLIRRRLSCSQSYGLVGAGVVCGGGAFGAAMADFMGIWLVKLHNAPWYELGTTRY